MTHQMDSTIDADGITTLWREYEPGAAASEAIHQTLREAIVHGFLPAGHRLGEVELADLLGVSRTPIREALHRLEMEGLAVRLQRRGLEVRRITLTEIQDAYEVYNRLVEMAVRLAASRISSADLNRLRVLNAQLAEALASKDSRRCVTIGDEFHRCLYRASGNDVLIRVLGQLRYHTRSLASATFQDDERADQIVSEHDLLITALAAGNEEMVAAVANLHNRNAMKTRVRLVRDRDAIRPDRR